MHAIRATKMHQHIRTMMVRLHRRHCQLEIKHIVATRPYQLTKNKIHNHLTSGCESDCIAKQDALHFRHFATQISACIAVFTM